MRGSGLFPLLCRQPVLRKMYIQDLLRAGELLAKPVNPHPENSQGAGEKEVCISLLCFFLSYFPPSLPPPLPLCPFISPSFLPSSLLRLLPCSLCLKKEMIELTRNTQNYQGPHPPSCHVGRHLLQTGRGSVSLVEKLTF